MKLRFAYLLSLADVKGSPDRHRFARELKVVSHAYPIQFHLRKFASSNGSINNSNSNPIDTSIRRMGVLNSSAFCTSCPSFTYLRTWALIVAAFLSHAPLPPCGSLRSTLRTLIPVLNFVRKHDAITAEL